jgi:hypothetical protein
MKQVVAISIFLFSALIANAQYDTTKVEQYCQVIATPRLFSNKVTIDINFGEEKNFWHDNRLKTYDGKFKKFNTVVDALNYMGQDGWIFINAYPVRIAETTIYHFAFKKQFSKSEVQL